jgi:hypothetical protein
VVWGYQLLPKLVQDQPRSASSGFAYRVYNWKATDGYVAGEAEKLRRTLIELERLDGEQAAPAPDSVEKLIRDYQDLVSNQKTVDQHIQYNRFWQRAIVNDRPRFDQLTTIYNLLRSEDPETTRIVSEVLGKPEVPSFIQVTRPQPEAVILRVPLYTDIQDQAYLEQVRSTIESYWQVLDEGTQYRVEVEFRPHAASPMPPAGAHIDLRSHAMRFPQDGAILTTGGETTYAFVGRFIALGPGDLSFRALAHEFGHVLGFRDGYVRGYQDLGSEGFEIMEVTSSFDDIMSSPTEGRVLPAHFKLLLENLR